MKNLDSRVAALEQELIVARIHIDHLKGELAPEKIL